MRFRVGTNARAARETKYRETYRHERGAVFQLLCECIVDLRDDRGDRVQLGLQEKQTLRQGGVDDTWNDAGQVRLWQWIKLGAWGDNIVQWQNGREERNKSRGARSAVQCGKTRRTLRRGKSCTTRAASSISARNLRKRCSMPSYVLSRPMVRREGGCRVQSLTGWRGVSISDAKANRFLWVCSAPELPVGTPRPARACPLAVSPRRRFPDQPSNLSSLNSSLSTPHSRSQQAKPTPLFRPSYIYHHV
jgi:hypothetical protein